MKKNLLLMTTVFFLSPNIWSQSLVEPPYLHSYGIRKATPAKLFMFFGPITKFDDPQGIATAKMKSRDDPKTMQDDDEVVVYGVNAGRNQIIYNTSMWMLALYGSKGSGDNQFLSPRGIAIDENGNVYVVDSGNNRIVHLFNPKKEVRWVHAFTGRSATDPGLLAPSQAALDRAGRIYITDTGNRRIVVFSPDGKVCQVFPASNSYQFEQGPSMLAVADGSDPRSFFHADRIIFCADKGGARLWKLGFNGTVEKQVSLPEGHRAGYAAVDYYHNLWVTDRDRHCILKYDHNLELLDIFGSYGEGKNQFVEPRGIAIWKRFGQTFVAERHGAQYFWIGTDCSGKNLRKIRDNNYTLSLTLTEYSFVSLYSAAEKDTSWLFRRWMAVAGRPSFPFSDEKQLLAKGRVFLRVEPTYSSYSFYKWDYPVTVEK
jgi:DNA-binding beta-propeller fold protein YncE